MRNLPFSTRELHWIEASLFDLFLRAKSDERIKQRINVTPGFCIWFFVLFFYWNKKLFFDTFSVCRTDSRSHRLSSTTRFDSMTRGDTKTKEKFHLRITWTFQAEHKWNCRREKRSRCSIKTNILNFWFFFSSFFTLRTMCFSGKRGEIAFEQRKKN